jgi:hypothetical protein
MAEENADRDRLWDQLANALGQVAKQDQIAWVIFSVFWAADAVLLVALFTTGQAPMPLVGIVVCLIGFALSYVWTVIEKRAIGYLRFYEKVVDALERQLNIPPEFALSGAINERFRTEVTGPSTRPLVIWCGRISAILWIGGLLWFVYRLACG